jgi:hypothetical protein
LIKFGWAKILAIFYNKKHLVALTVAVLSKTPTDNNLLSKYLVRLNAACSMKIEKWVEKMGKINRYVE